MEATINLKTIGKIDLPIKQAATESQRYKWFMNFKSEYDEKLREIINLANQKLGGVYITISKTAKKKEYGEFVEQPGYHSIYGTCEYHLFDETVKTPFCIWMKEIEHDIRKMTKADIVKLAYGSRFFVMRHDEVGSIRLHDAIKIHTGKKDAKIGISCFYVYEKRNDFFYFDDIIDCGVVERDTFFYINNETENI